MPRSASRTWPCDVCACVAATLKMLARLLSPVARASSLLPKHRDCTCYAAGISGEESPQQL